MNELLRAAGKYQELGYSVVPILKDKKSCKGWQEYQKRSMSHRELLYWFGEAASAIAVVCGAISGQLEVIDIDLKNDPTRELFFTFCAGVEERLPGFITDQAVLATTRNGGFHVFYRSPDADRSRVIARRPATEAERLADPDDKARILIETRGNGGYVLVSPSPGYSFFQGDLSTVPLIASFERMILLDIARSSDTFTPLRYQRRAHPGIYSKVGSPLDDYNNRGDVVALLSSHGWIVIRETADKTVFRRPGQTDHDTSGDFHHGLNLFTVFTSSTDFIPFKGYSRSAVFAVLECKGDFSLAAKLLLENGYGIPYKKLIL